MAASTVDREKIRRERRDQLTPERVARSWQIRFARNWLTWHDGQYHKTRNPVLPWAAIAKALRQDLEAQFRSRKPCEPFRLRGGTVSSLSTQQLRADDAARVVLAMDVEVKPARVVQDLLGERDRRDRNAVLCE